MFGEGITVVSEDGVFRAPGEVGGDIVRKDMDFELAKALTAAFIKNIEVFQSKTPFMKNVYLGETDPKLTSLCGPMLSACNARGGVNVPTGCEWVCPRCEILAS